MKKKIIPAKPFLWGIGFHKDKTLDLDEEAPIVSISLGRPGRPYILRDNIFQPTQQSFGLWQIGYFFCDG